MLRWVKVGIVLPILWTLAEFARERLLIGFGWGAIGYSQIVKESPLAGFAPLGGIHLVMLATAFVSAWLVLLIDNTGRLKQRLLPMCMIVMLCTVGFNITNFVTLNPFRYFFGQLRYGADLHDIYGRPQ